MPDISTFINGLPGYAAQGVIWGIMALGLYISYRLLDFADLTVDGSFATGAAVTVMLILAGTMPFDRERAKTFMHCAHSCGNSDADSPLFREPAYSR